MNQPHEVSFNSARSALYRVFYPFLSTIHSCVDKWQPRVNQLFYIHLLLDFPSIA
jgi:hypothetical protein